MKISPAKFQQLVEEGLSLIPEEFRRHIQNVAITIEDKPGNELLDDLGIPDGDTLYGLYTGTPLPDRALEGEPLYPDKITIYRQPLLKDFTEPGEIRREVARTVIHEIAHHFGIEEDRLTELGWD